MLLAARAVVMPQIEAAARAAARVLPCPTSVGLTCKMPNSVLMNREPVHAFGRWHVYQQGMLEQGAGGKGQGAGGEGRGAGGTLGQGAGGEGQETGGEGRATGCEGKEQEARGKRQGQGTGGQGTGAEERGAGQPRARDARWHQDEEGSEVAHLPF